MKERRSDTVEAIIAAVALHAVLFLLVYFGLPWWNPAPVNPAGPPIEAELIDPNALSASMRRALATRPEQVVPQPAPPEEVEAGSEGARCRGAARHGRTVGALRALGGDIAPRRRTGRRSGVTSA